MDGEGYRWVEVVMGVGGCKNGCIGRRVGGKVGVRAIGEWRLRWEWMDARMGVLVVGLVGKVGVRAIGGWRLC